MKKYVVGIGEVLFDCLPQGKKLGGAPANFAYHAAQMGLKTIAVSAIGNDADGAEIQQQLKAQGLNVLLQTVPYPTGTVQVTLSNKGIPQYDICQHVAYDYIPWTPQLEQLAQQTQVVCFGTLAQRSPVSHATILRFLDTMPQGDDVLKVFDINLRQNWYTKSVVEESLKRCNILKINDEEISVIAKLLDKEVQPWSQCFNIEALPQGLQQLMQWLCQHYQLKALILTCGAQGSVVLSGKQFYTCSVSETNAIDTVGAGDSFTGVFCAALLQHKDIPTAQQMASKVAAYVCTQPGAMPPYPSTLAQF